MPPDRFITDSSLDFVARRLRVLGFDVLTLGAGDLESLYRAAKQEGRTVLTLSRRHPHRHADVPALVVERGDPIGALRMVAEHHRPAGPPFSRCTICNLPLELRPTPDGAGEVPARVRSEAKALRHCSGCGRWYWRGSHVDRLRAWLEQALGWSIPFSDPPGDAKMAP